LISANLQIDGNLTTDGEIQVDGQVNGDVTCGKLTVGEKSRIAGEITADDVQIRGEVEGRIRARSVQLAKSAKVIGDIWHEVLSIESGAQLDGLCKHTTSPREQDAKTTGAAATPIKQPAESASPAAAAQAKDQAKATGPVEVKKTATG
jgi:cytoskeletal protein CcmA (bactofilin family)